MSIELVSEFINVSTNWNVADEKKLIQTFSATPKLDDDSVIEVSDIVSLESCVPLAINDSKDRCWIDINVNPVSNKRIAKLHIVSEAHTLEFYKQCGEYAGTTCAELIDDVNSVYLAEFTFQPPCSEARIKFMRSKAQDAMWVYGIRLEMQMDISLKDKDYYNFGEMLNSRLTENNIQANGKFSLMQKIFESFTLNNANGDEIKQNGSGVETNNVVESKLEERLMTHLNMRMDHLERQLFKRIDESESRILERIDKMQSELQNR